jgi:hypothetical protein
MDYVPAPFGHRRESSANAIHSLELIQMFFRKKPPAHKLTTAQIVERFRSHVSDEIDLAMEDRRGDFVLMKELSRTLNGMTQIIEMWRLSRPL